jgi:hypothetical protein
LYISGLAKKKNFKLGFRFGIFFKGKKKKRKEGTQKVIYKTREIDY